MLKYENVMYLKIMSYFNTFHQVPTNVLNFMVWWIYFMIWPNKTFTTIILRGVDKSILLLTNSSTLEQS